MNSKPRSARERLVAEAPDDLVVAILTGDHQQLFQLLRGLRKGVERPRKQPGRHQEVAGALGRAPAQHRRLDVDEAPLVQILADRADHPVPEREHVRHLRPPQIEIAVLQAQVLVRLGPVLDRERRREERNWRRSTKRCSRRAWVSGRLS